MKKGKKKYIPPDVDIIAIENDIPLAYTSWRTPDGVVLPIIEGDPPEGVSAKRFFHSFNIWDDDDEDEDEDTWDKLD